MKINFRLKEQHSHSIGSMSKTKATNKTSIQLAQDVKDWLAKGNTIKQGHCAETIINGHQMDYHCIRQIISATYGRTA